MSSYDDSCDKVSGCFFALLVAIEGAIFRSLDLLEGVGRNLYRGGPNCRVLSVLQIGGCLN